METKTIALQKTTVQTIEYSLLALSFFIPLFISGPQLLTGVVVNMFLFLITMRSYSTKSLLMIALPSVGALLNGLIFGTFTPYLLYFLPFIWMSNYVLVQSFRFISLKKPFLMSLIGSSVMKSLFLFVIAYIFTSTKIVPQIFLQAMGIFQLITALLGGGIAFGVNKIISQKE